MKTPSIKKFTTRFAWIPVAVIALALIAAGYVEAGGLGDRNNRGGTTFRNQGAAAGGNLSAKRPAKPAQTGKKAPLATQKSGAKTGTAQQPKTGKTTSKTPSKTTSGTQKAQTKSTTNQQNRQQTMSNNQQNRQEAINDHDDWDNDDCLTENCNGGAFLAGAAIGAATTAIVTQPSQSTTTAPATTTTTTTTTTEATAAPPPGLPCDPAVQEVGGITYYACDQDYYILAYGAAGPTYTPVPPPQ